MKNKKITKSEAGKEMIQGLKDLIIKDNKAEPKNFLLFLNQQVDNYNEILRRICMMQNDSAGLGVKLVKVMLDYQEILSINPSAVDENNISAIDYAFNNNHHEICDLLKLFWFAENISGSKYDNESSKNKNDDENSKNINNEVILNLNMGALQSLQNTISQINGMLTTNLSLSQQRQSSQNNQTSFSESFNEKISLSNQDFFTYFKKTLLSLVLPNPASQPNNNQNIIISEVRSNANSVPQNDNAKKPLSIPQTIMDELYEVVGNDNKLNAVVNLYQWGRYRSAFLVLLAIKNEKTVETILSILLKHKDKLPFNVNDLRSNSNETLIEYAEKFQSEKTLSILKELSANKISQPEIQSVPGNNLQTKRSLSKSNSSTTASNLPPDNPDTIYFKSFGNN